MLARVPVHTRLAPLRLQGHFGGRWSIFDNNLEVREHQCTTMDLEHQRCYIYQPREGEERAPKRQRIERPGFQSQLKERLQVYRDLWAEQEQRIQVIPATKDA